MRRLVAYACTACLALGPLALTGCGSMSAVYGASTDGGDGGPGTLGDGGPGDTDGGPVFFDGGTNPDGGAGDGGILGATDLTFSIAEPSCAPDGSAAFELTLTPKHLACRDKAQASGMDRVVLDIWSFPFGPETVRFGPDLPANGQGIWCHGPSLVCETAVSGKIVLTDWPGRPGPVGSFLLTFQDGTRLAGGFGADWCMHPVPCR